MPEVRRDLSPFVGKWPRWRADGSCHDRHQVSTRPVSPMNTSRRPSLGSQHLLWLDLGPVGERHRFPLTRSRRMGLPERPTPPRHRLRNGSPGFLLEAEAEASAPRCSTGKTFTRKGHPRSVCPSHDAVGDVHAALQPVPRPRASGRARAAAPTLRRRSPSSGSVSNGESAGQPACPRMWSQVTMSEQDMVQPLKPNGAAVAAGAGCPHTVDQKPVLAMELVRPAGNPR